MARDDLARRARSPFVDVLIHNLDGTAQSISGLDKDFMRQLETLKYTETDKKGISEKAVLTFNDPDYDLMAADIFPEDAQVTLLLGTREDLYPRGPFYVKAGSPKFPDGSPQLIVELTDKSKAMHDKSLFKSFEVSSLATAVQAIAEFWGLGYHIFPPAAEIKISRKVTTAGNSAAQMLSKLAEKYGFTWRIRSGVLMFVPEDHVSERVTVLHYRTGDGTCKSFDPKIKRTPAQVPSHAKGIDPITKKSTEPDEAERKTTGEGDDNPPVPAEKHFYDSGIGQWLLKRLGKASGGKTIRPTKADAPPNDAEEAKHLTAATVRKAKYDIEGTLKPTFPSMHYRTGDIVVVAGLPKIGTRYDLSASYTLTEVVQTFTRDSWDTGPFKFKGATRKEGNSELTKHDERAGDSESNADGENVNDPKGEEITLEVYDSGTGLWSPQQVKKGM